MQQTINTTPGSADTAPQGAVKINANFTELYGIKNVGYFTSFAALVAVAAPSSVTPGAAALVGNTVFVSNGSFWVSVADSTNLSFSGAL